MPLCLWPLFTENSPTADVHRAFAPRSPGRPDSVHRVWQLAARSAARGNPYSGRGSPSRRAARAHQVTGHSCLRAGAGAVWALRGGRLALAPYITSPSAVKRRDFAPTVLTLLLAAAVISPRGLSAVPTRTPVVVRIRALAPSRPPAPDPPRTQHGDAPREVPELCELCGPQCQRRRRRRLDVAAHAVGLQRAPERGLLAGAGVAALRALPHRLRRARAERQAGAGVVSAVALPSRCCRAAVAFARADVPAIRTRTRAPQRFTQLGTQEGTQAPQCAMRRRRRTWP